MLVLTVILFCEIVFSLVVFYRVHRHFRHLEEDLREGASAPSPDFDIANPVTPWQRAFALLMGSLTEEERERYAQQGILLVRGRSGRRYKLIKAHSNNIVILSSDGLGLALLCANMPGVTEIEDQLLAQKLALESVHENKLLAAANWSWIQD